MKIAETVTFGGSGLDRAAHLRDQATGLRTHPHANVIGLWRGKPLLQGDKLMRLACDHPAITDAAPEFVFLGLEGDNPVFAADFSRWTPDDQSNPDPAVFLDPTVQEHPLIPGGAFLELRSVMTRLDARDAELAATARAVFEWHRSHGFCARCGAKSAQAQGGWRRDCAACGATHFPRTDPVVIMLITHGNSVLVGRSPHWPEGMYSLLAGFVEPGEPIEAAVRREVFEETGVKVGDVTYLSSQPWPFPTSLMFGCAGVATSREITIDPEEIEDATWITREDMTKVFLGEHPTMTPAREGAIAHFLLRAWLADQLD